MNDDLKGHAIRTAIVTKNHAGYIYAGDLSKERDEEPYTKILTWSPEKTVLGECNFDAHTGCVITDPEKAVVCLSANGYFGITAKGKSITGDIFEMSLPKTLETRNYGIESVCEIDRCAYAVGLNGIAYKLENLDRWTRIDQGLPESAHLTSISGFNKNDLYAVGKSGQMWRRRSSRWSKQELPTNVNLSSARAGGDGFIYVVGKSGIVLQGIEDSWRYIGENQIQDDVWDVEWFDNSLYVSTMKSVYKFVDGAFEIVNFGLSGKVTCYQLSTFDGILWSSGEFDIVAFNGSDWSRVL